MPVPETVDRDLVLVPTWVRMPDLDRHGTGMEAPSTAFNVNPLGSLVCVTEEGHSKEIEAKYWMLLDSQDIIKNEYFSKSDDGEWTGKIHIRYNTVQWADFMDALVADDVLPSAHKSVETLPDATQGPNYLEKDAYVKYDRDTEMWSLINEDSGYSIDVYCGYKVIFVDNEGEHGPYYAASGLPEFEGNTGAPEGTVFIGWLDNWNKQATPGDAEYVPSNPSVDTIYVTATYFAPLGFEESAPYDDTELFSFSCGTDPFEEGHGREATYRLLKEAGVEPEYGELATFYDMYFIQDMTLTAEQIQTVLDFMSSEEILSNGILSELYLELRHQLLTEEPLTITMICMDVDVPEGWTPSADPGALPGGASVMGLGVQTASLSKGGVRGGHTANVISGSWEPLDPLMGEDLDELETRCAYIVTFMNADGSAPVNENGDEIKWASPIFFSFCFWRI